MSIESGYKIDNYREQTAQHKELYLAPCGDLNEKEVQKGGGIFIFMADSACCAVGTNTGVPKWSGKEPTSQRRRHEFNPWVWKIPWRRK